MAGHDADGGDPDRPDVDPAGHRQAERIAGSGPDPGVAFDGADDAIGLELDPLELVFGVADFVGEGRIEDAEPRPELRGVGLPQADRVVMHGPIVP